MPRQKKPNERLKETVHRRILARAAKSDEPIVLIVKQGTPHRVYGFTEYQRMVSLPSEVKPWEHRQTRAKRIDPVPDPLGAVDAEPPQPLNRASLYEE